jgi:hypothetical protein
MKPQDDLFEPEPDGSERPKRADETKREAALKLLRQVQEGVASAIALLEGGEAPHTATLALMRANKDARELVEEEEKVLQGIFDGSQMVGNDGRSYQVPANYASKSKLVEGDVMKLTVRKDGSFVFKQIGPVERKRLVGKLTQDPSTGDPLVLVGSTPYKVLNASVSFYRASMGDEVVILVPKGARAVWGAVENVMKR